MHDIRFIRENREGFIKGLSSRGIDDAEGLVNRLIEFDDARKNALQVSEEMQAQKNRISKEIGQAKSRGDEARFQELLSQRDRYDKELGRGGAKLTEERARELNNALAEVPNLPNPPPDVPVGQDEHGNVERKDHRFNGSRGWRGEGREHFEIGEAMGFMDFETAAKLSGSRFVVLRGQLARLERALGQFMLDLHTGEHGYTEVAPPLLVRDEVMFGTAQLPKFKDDQFAVLRNVTAVEKQLQFIRQYKSKLTELQFSHGLSRDEAADQVHAGRLHEEIMESELTETSWLIPTAEVPLTNLVRESILSEDELPLRFAALTPCFRAEAGAAGRDTRGMLRQHQFTKCELVSITVPERSADEHERMLASAEAVLKRLDLPYRVMTLCTGDMGFASAKTYDIEVWLPGQRAYREISSCSVCNDFQARRMNARYRPKEGKGPRFVHTLNGSGVAVGRALIAVMENYQNEDGSVTVPEALAPYMGGLKRIEKAV